MILICESNVGKLPAYRCYVLNFEKKIDPVVLEKNGRQLIAIDHLSDSGDLNIFKSFLTVIVV